VDLQELISRGRFVFSNAPRSLEVFKLVNGKLSSKEIAMKTGRMLSAVLNDLKKMRDMDLIRPKTDALEKISRKDGCVIFEKVPLVRHVPLSYFQGITKGKIVSSKRHEFTVKKARSQLYPLSMPSANEILDICKHGEDQIYEFKAPRVETAKMAKEVSAFLNTKQGGLLFYGIDDDGSIVGSDMRRQDFDQALQNSIRNTISPRPSIDIKEIDLLGHKVLVVIVPPWDRKNIYQYTKEQRVYIRKGSNVFVASPEELKRLGQGEYVD
jgi:hypothetical protein